MAEIDNDFNIIKGSTDYILDGVGIDRHRREGLNQTATDSIFSPFQTPSTSRPNFFNPSAGPVLPASRTTYSIRSGTRSLFSPHEGKVKEEGRDSPFAPEAPITPPNPTAMARLSAAVEKTTAHQASVHIHGDSDDDLEIIDASKASLEAQTKWQEVRPHIALGGETTPLTPIKAEPNENNNRIPSCFPKSVIDAKASTLTDILAAQRALINKGKATNRDCRNGSHKPTGELSPRTSSARNRYFEGQVVLEDPEQVDAAMGANSQEDDSWMHEEVKDDAQAEIDILREKIKELSRKEKNGKISEVQMFELIRCRKFLILKEKMRHAARGSPSRQPQEESLFVPDDRDEALRRKRSEQQQCARRGRTPDMDFGGEEDGEFGIESREASEALLSHMLQQELDGNGLDGVPSETEIPKTRKPRKKVAKDAREFFFRGEEERREKERAKAQKQKRAGNGVRGGRKVGPRGKSAARKKGKGAVKGGKSVKPARDAFGMSQPQAFARFNQADGVDVIGQMMIDEIMNNDPISDRLQNPIFKVGAEPDMFGNHTKSTQLQRLLANIPEGSSEKEAKSDRAKLKQASKSFGYAQVKAVDGKWLIKGMKSTLYHHQLLGAQWMIQRELSADAPYGGLLADGMGLGKTVQTLACMVGNPPGEQDRKRGVKATLIVVPSSVIDQWLEEIRTHAEKAVFPKIMRYRSAAKIPIEVLRDLDIVVTSYSEVMRQFPFPDLHDRARIAEIGCKKWCKEASKSMGDLFEVYWYRVVLDEAHAIKNNSARTSLACQNLRSIYRWCLTGTPLLNRLEELFPYLRFLKANYSMDWKTFQRYFCDPDASDAHTRIATLLSYTMMRRTMKTSILNRPIITLPTPHPEIRFVDFSAEERTIYRITENRFRANLNVYIANGTASKNYAVFLVQLLRLRQCTSHPYMLERTIRESWTSSDLKELRARLKALGKHNVPFYEQCNVWIKQTEEERQAAIDGDEDPNTACGESMPFGAGDYGHSFEMGKVLKTVSEKEAYSRVTCSLCSDLPRSPVVTDCDHIFCHECLQTYMHQKTALDDDYLTCPFCNKIFVSFKAHKNIPDANDEDAMESASPDASQSTFPKGKKRKSSYGAQGKGSDALGYEPKVADSTWVDKSDSHDFPLVPSAKTAALKAILLRSFKEAPTDKVVIYVQFRLLAKIIGRICHSENWGFLYLTGECSLDHRSKVIKMFREDSEVKVLIAGLKCGGLGLNFPWANRCVSLDLWWNHAVEQQAFGRIFRIGQKKETYMTRIIVKNTVDMRLLSMQLHKLRACDRAVDGSGEGAASGGERPSLSLRELASLFGFLRTAEDGTLLEIIPDYADEGEGSGETGDRESTDGFVGSQELSID